MRAAKLLPPHGRQDRQAASLVEDKSFQIIEDCRRLSYDAAVDIEGRQETLRVEPRILPGVQRTHGNIGERYGLEVQCYAHSFSRGILPA